jgi:hypothetical protein
MPLVRTLKTLRLEGVRLVRVSLFKSERGMLKGRGF